LCKMIGRAPMTLNEIVGFVIIRQLFPQRQWVFGVTSGADT